MIHKSGLLFLIGFLFCLATTAQQVEKDWCGTTALDEIYKNRDPNYRIFRRTQENTVIEESDESKSGALIQIPVVVHVLYRMDIQNISETAKSRLALSH